MVQCQRHKEGKWGSLLQVGKINSKNVLWKTEQDYTLF
jgi:hypothetical protein